MKINFQAPKKVESQSFFIGRNGCFKMNGLEIKYFASRKFFTINPITSNGKLGHCQIEIPNDSTVINDLIRFLVDNQKI